MLRSYLDAVWRRKWIGLAAVVAITSVALVATLRQEALYEASAEVLVNRQEAATTSLIGQTPALDDAARTMATQIRLSRVPLVLGHAVAASGLTSVSPTRLRDRSSVSADADLLRFTVSDQDPARAARLASAYARAFVRYRRQLDTVGLATTLSELGRQLEKLEAEGRVDSPLYDRLADREQQLESLTALRTSNVSVVRTAVAEDAEKVAPRPRRNLALAVAAGLIVGLVLIFLWESLGTKPRTEKEFELLLGAPLLAWLRFDGRGDGTRAEAVGAEADAIHTLRTNLELATRRVGARRIMITSPSSGEGKSATSVQLAAALARAGRRVALVDLDLRESALTRLVGLEGRPGAAELARGECALDAVLVSLSVARGTVGWNGRSEADGRLDAVSSGRLDVHPAELLSSSALATALEELGGRADVVLVDVPPVLEAPDAAALADELDGLLLVVDARRARGPILAHVRSTIESWPIVRLGFALTEGGDPSQASAGLAALPQPLVAESERVT